MIEYGAYSCYHIVQCTYIDHLFVTRPSISDSHFCSLRNYCHFAIKTCIYTHKFIKFKQKKKKQTNKHFYIKPSALLREFIFLCDRWTRWTNFLLLLLCSATYSPCSMFIFVSFVICTLKCGSTMQFDSITLALFFSLRFQWTDENVQCNTPKKKFTLNCWFALGFFMFDKFMPFSLCHF